MLNYIGENAQNTLHTFFFNDFTGNYNGVYWYVMDSIGGMLNYIGENAQNTQQKWIL